MAGVDVMRQYWYENTDWLALPIISWNGGTNGQFTGSSFADFLLGRCRQLPAGRRRVQRDSCLDGRTLRRGPDQGETEPDHRLGLRYEPWIAPVVTGGRIGVYIPGQQSTRYPAAPAGLVFPGDYGVPSAGVPSDYKKFFDPRVGYCLAAKGMAHYFHSCGHWHVCRFRWTMPTSTTHRTCTRSVQRISSAAGINREWLADSDHSLHQPWSVYTPLGGQNPFPPFSSPGTVPP